MKITVDMYYNIKIALDKNEVTNLTTEFQKMIMDLEQANRYFINDKCSPSEKSEYTATYIRMMSDITFFQKLMQLSGISDDQIGLIAAQSEMPF
jgi:hypothetical protein